MAVKNTIHQYCPKCGELNAYVKSGMVMLTRHGSNPGHLCYVPGPPDAPRPIRLKDVIFKSV